jgi:hypothetical protein
MEYKKSPSKLDLVDSLPMEKSIVVGFLGGSSPCCYPPKRKRKKNGKEVCSASLALTENTLPLDWWHSTLSMSMMLLDTL